MGGLRSNIFLAARRNLFLGGDKKIVEQFSQLSVCRKVSRIDKTSICASLKSCTSTDVLESGGHPNHQSFTVEVPDMPSQDDIRSLVKFEIIASDIHRILRGCGYIFGSDCSYKRCLLLHSHLTKDAPRRLLLESIASLVRKPLHILPPAKTILVRINPFVHAKSAARFLFWLLGPVCIICSYGGVVTLGFCWGRNTGRLGYFLRLCCCISIFLFGIYLLSDSRMSRIALSTFRIYSTRGLLPTSRTGNHYTPAFAGFRSGGGLCQNGSNRVGSRGLQQFAYGPHAIGDSSSHRRRRP